MEQAVGVISEALALALDSDVTLRLDLSRAMWSSSWRENKLILQNYLTGEPGSRLMTAMRQATGNRAEQLEDALDMAGPLDFYPPFAEQREHWSPSARMAVLGIYDPDTHPVPGFLPNGDPFSYEGNPAPAPEVPVIAIHRAEHKFSKTATDTGRPVPVPGTALDWAPNPDTTYLDEVKNHVEDEIGASEIIVTATFQDAVDQLYGYHEWGPTSMSVGNSTGDELGRALFNDVLPDSSLMHIRVKYYEDDTGGSGQPDFYGQADIDWSESGYFKPIYDYQTESTLVGRVRLVWQSADPQEVESLNFNRATYSNMTEGTSSTLTIQAYDANGYLISFSDPNNDDADVTSRWSEDTDVVTVGAPEYESNAAHTTLSAIDGMAGGSAWVYITVGLRGFVTDSLNISVTECRFGQCQN